MTIIFRTDASAAIGTGHLMRCLAFSQECKAQSFHPVFVLAIATPLEERLRQEGMEVVRIGSARGSTNDAEEMVRIVKERAAQWVIVDGYDFDAAYQRRIRDAGFKLLVIDDYAHLPEYDCDVLFNQNIDAVESMYEGKADAKLLLGPKYPLIRPEFLRFRNRERDVARIATRILVTFGGVDVANGTAMVLRALAKVGDPFFEVRVIVGAENPRDKELKDIAHLSPHTITFEKNVSDMSEPMIWADLAIVAAGSTLWELMLLGTPFIVGVLAENQEGNARVLAERGLALSIGWYNECSEDALAREIEQLVCDRALRERMSFSCRETIDGRGVERGVNVLRKLP